MDITDLNSFTLSAMRDAYTALVRLSSYSYAAWDMAMREFAPEWNSNTALLVVRKAQLSKGQFKAVVGLFTNGETFSKTLSNARASKETHLQNAASEVDYNAFRNYLAAQYPQLAPILRPNFESSQIALGLKFNITALIPELDPQNWTGAKGIYVSVRFDGNHRFYAGHLHIDAPLTADCPVATFSASFPDLFEVSSRTSDKKEYRPSVAGFVLPTMAGFSFIGHALKRQDVLFASMEMMSQEFGACDFLGVVHSDKTALSLPIARPFYLLQISDSIDPGSLPAGELGRRGLEDLLKASSRLDGESEEAAAESLEFMMLNITKTMGLAEPFRPYTTGLSFDLAQVPQKVL